MTETTGTAVQTADLYDERGEELQSVPLQFRTLARTRPLAGLSAPSAATRTTAW